MDPIRYLKAFRRRWLWIVACVVVALAAGWFTTETVAPTAGKAGPAQYSAEALLLSDGSSLPLNTLAVVATTPPVLERVANATGYPGDPLELAGSVTAVPDIDTGILSIQSIADEPAKAEEIALAFKNGLIGFLTFRARGDIQRQIDIVDAKIASLDANADPTIRAGYEAERADLEQQWTDATDNVGLETLADPVATEVSFGGFQAPESRSSRLAIVGLIGLLAGLALALILERFDTKVRSRENAEERFAMPVVGEVPDLPRSGRHGIVTAGSPTSQGADAFRLLGAGVGVATPLRETEGDPLARTVLVTSPGPAEGKTLVAANLAAALAEEGSAVLVVSADLRRPKIHNLFGATPSPGLVDAVRRPQTLLSEVVQPSSIDGISILASGARTARPGSVLGSSQFKAMLAKARERFDWIVIDTSPLLAATESAHLLPEADLVLLVAMSGSTSTALAHRASETLQQLDAPNARVVLNRSHEMQVPASYRLYSRRSAVAGGNGQVVDEDSALGFDAMTKDEGT